MDVTTLKITVDSRGVDKGKIALDQLSTAARRAQAAMSAASASMKSAGTAAVAAASDASKAVAALNAQGAAATKAAAAMRAYSAATNSSAAALKAANAGGGQLQGATGSMGKSMSILGEAILSAVSPTRYLTMGVDALVAAGVQMVDWPELASVALIGVADVLEDIAPYAVGAAAALALIHAPMIVGGIGTMIGLMRTLSVSALRTAASFAATWLAAIGPVGVVIAAIAAVAAGAIMFRDELAQIFGVDIVQAAKTGANYIIGSFVAAYHNLQFIWNNFPDMVSAAAIGAVNAVIRGVNDMIVRVKEGVNVAIGYLNKLPGVEIELNDPDAFPLKQLDNPDAGRLASANFDRTKRNQEYLGRDYLGEFGEGFTSRVSGVTDMIRGLGTSLGNGGATTVTNVGGGGKAEDKGYDEIAAGADKKIASLLAERDMLGMTEEAAAALRYEQDLLNQAQEKGLDLSPKQAARLKLQAEMMAGLEAATKKAKEAMEFAKELTKGFVSDLRQGLANGEGFWKSFSTAALNALDRIVDKLLNDVLDAVFQVNQPGVDGGGSWWQSLLGGIGSLFGGGGGTNLPDPFQDTFDSAKGNVFSDPGIGAFSNSIVSRPTLFPFARGIGLMGEAGPEAIMPLRRDGQGRLGVAAANQNGGTTVQIVDQRGRGTIGREETTGPNGEQLVRLIIKDELRTYAAGSFNRHVSNNAEAKKRIRGY